ncbi:MAG: MgtC/SapB family protein [Sphingobacteriaceae bacterium]
MIASDDLLRIGISVACGALLGFEREYRNKSAGFRTLILITLGSTVFTMISERMGDDRVIANIITGIGFIGAGVIFKDNYSVTGLTTAAVIWMAAAIGMVVGLSDYNLSISLALIVVFILSVFHGLENLLDWVHHRKSLVIMFKDDSIESLVEVETYLKNAKLSLTRLEVVKKQDKLMVTLLIFGRKNRIRALDSYLLSFPQIEQFNLTQSSR